MICRNNNGIIENRKNMRGGEGTVEVNKLFEKLPYKCRMIGVLTLEKGASIGEHEHINEGELFYVLSGAARYYDDGVATIITEGDSALVYNGRHSVEGISDEPCRLLAVIIND